jgi:hypothetical protein
LAYGPGWNGEIDDDVIRDAAQNHAEIMFNAVGDTFLRTLEISENVTNERSTYYLKFGAARRLEMIWFAWRNVVFTVPADREKPLQTVETRQLTQNLNTIYINISGTIDNLAWALLHEIAPELVVKLKPRQIGLFSSCITANVKFTLIVGEIMKHDTWNKELKNRRDPSAHRIPLTVPPQVVNNEEAEIYAELGAKTWQAIGRGDPETAQKLMKQQEKIGRFVPWFLHDPAEGPIPIYPTVSEDLRHLIEILRVVDGFITRREVT